jgi:NADPH2:quinone reductase
VKTQAVRLHQPGGPEALVFEEVELRPPSAGEALITQEAIGVNYIDIQQRSGRYPLELPAIIGSEGAGVVDAVGPGVTQVRPGDRVAYGLSAGGAYSKQRLIPADRLIALPADVTATTAAAFMLKGLTAEYLLRRTYPVRSGQTIVVHAAAGATGSILVQWGKALGARVIGVVGSAAKAEAARLNGCDRVLLSTEPFSAHVREMTGGRGAAVVYDSVGRDTFDESLACLAPMGCLALFGQASGPVPPVDVARLAKGSFFLTRPTLFHYDAAREDMVAGATALFDVVRAGGIRLTPPTVYSLANAAEAHRAIESRRTTGALVLVP